MKTKLLVSILGLAAVSSFGEGFILLDNYNTYGPDVTYPSYYGALGGTGLQAGWTMGLYYALGDVTGAVAPDPVGLGDPATLGPLTLGTGPGSIALFDSIMTADTPGEVWATSPFAVPGTSSSGGDLITVVLVAYDGASFQSSRFAPFGRGHSKAFTMTTSAYNSVSVNKIGDFMPGFTVAFSLEPEPSTTAFICLIAGLWLSVRRKRS